MTNLKRQGEAIKVTNTWNDGLTKNYGLGDMIGSKRVEKELNLIQYSNRKSQKAIGTSDNVIKTRTC